ncbi:probable photosystem II repair protein PSB27-H1, chloroplastic at C-terminar half [Coccomyxa sp. Obi]|nr:probable photosystem II repair protein PSB27-H1, chloroplastic at C-terminar half [Coccomyxa sp. Obi]
MDGIFALGPIPFQGTAVSRNVDKKEQWKHLYPRMCRTRSLPLDHHVGSPPGKSYEDIHRRNLLALGLFLSAAQAAGQASAGQSNSQLADRYYDRTSEMVGKIKEVLDVDLTSDDSKGQLEEFKKAANAYVADYRRLVSPGQKSFAEVYGVITAMIGHFTVFGLGKKPFPAKLKEKQEKRVAVAERLLERELARERKVAVVVPPPTAFVG